MFSPAIPWGMNVKRTYSAFNGLMRVTIPPIFLIGKLTLIKMIIHLSFKCRIYKGL